MFKNLVGNNHGIRITNSLTEISMRAPRLDEQEVRILQEIRNRLKREISNYFGLELIVFLLDGEKKSVKANPAYKAIKTCCDLEFGIPSQCILAKNVFPPKEQVISNILLKINCKLGGTNFVLSEANKK